MGITDNHFLPCGSRRLTRQWNGVRVVLVITLLAFGATWAADPRRSAAGESQRPNVVLLMADDLGWSDTGFQGNQVIQTPHLDSLARQGMIFRRFYAAAPVCSPTRGSCLTGRHPSRYGVPTANAGHLRASEVTLAEVLRQQGYATGHFGKWHLGTLTPDFSGKGPRRNPKKNFMTPAMAGFDEWFSTEYAVATWDPYKQENAHGRYDVRALYWHNGRNITDGVAAGLTGCDSRIIMDHALPFIENAAQRKQPFFAVIWFHAPHQPVVGGPPYLARYSRWPENQRHYYAVITALDDQVGRFIGKLRVLGVDQETLIFFCSDNGPEGNPGPKGRSQGSAAPLRGRKRSLYEGGIRVPAFAVWPRQIPAGTETAFPAVTSDYFPTILAILGLPLPDQPRRAYDGISLVPVFQQTRRERAHPIGFQFGGTAAVIDDRYKLVHHRSTKRHRSDNGKTPVATWELYDLLNDPSETTNIAKKHPDQVARFMRCTWIDKETLFSVRRRGHPIFRRPRMRSRPLIGATATAS